MLLLLFVSSLSFSLVHLLVKIVFLSLVIPNYDVMHKYVPRKIIACLDTDKKNSHRIVVDLFTKTRFLAFVGSIKLKNDFSSWIM